MTAYSAKRKKHNIVLIGMPTSGKTTFSSLLAEALQVPKAETDDIVTEMLGTTIRECFETKGEAYFRALETKAAESLNDGREKIISCGGGAVTKEETMRVLSEDGFLIWIRRDLAHLFPTDSRPLSSSREKLAKLYREREPLYAKYADASVDNNDTKEETLAALLAVVRAYREDR